MKRNSSICTGIATTTTNQCSGQNHKTPNPRVIHTVYSWSIETKKCNLADTKAFTFTNCVLMI